MRLTLGILALYALVASVLWGVRHGWVLPPTLSASVPPSFDQEKFLTGVKQVGVVVGLTAPVPVEGKLVTDAQVLGTAYDPASGILRVWVSGTVRSAPFVFSSNCYVAEAGGWFCTRATDVGGLMRVH